MRSIIHPKIRKLLFRFIVTKLIILLKDKIFEPFYTTKPLGEGSGLGLSVVHGIIKSHKGEISIAQNIPKGTIFKIKLPLNF